MGLATAITTTETTEVALKPALKTKLRRELHTYAELRAQSKALELAMDKHKATISTLREEAGVNSLAFEGFHVTLVSPMRSTLDKQKLVAMGVSMEMIQEATTVKPGRPYEKVTCPGEKTHEDV